MTSIGKSDSVSAGAIVFESKYAGFTRGKIINNETNDPGLGYTIAYHGEGLGEVTIYVYNNGHPDVPDGPSSELVLEEFNRTTQEVFEVGEAAARPLELVDRYGTGSPERGKQFLCAEFVVKDEFGPRRSFLYLTGVAKQFVKIRISLRTNDPRDSTARNFADAVATTLWHRTNIPLH